MFKRSIDDKPKYTDNNNNTLVDLGYSIFSTDKIFNSIGYTVYKVSENLTMRPDLVARAAYGDEDRTELLLKYNNVQNPFTVNANDIMIFPSSTQIDSYVGTPVEVQKQNADELIRQFHKYVDKNKKPDTIGSEKNDSKIQKSDSDLGLSRLTGNTATRLGGNGNDGIIAATGAGYGGVSTNPSLRGGVATPANRFKEANMAAIGTTAIKEIDGRLYFGANAGVKCAADGITTSEYMKEIIKNSTDKK